ncbi:MAG: four helix bundle protein [Cyclobacteriaceae bacterium]|nr:four helix bundle protein [Cyclobacteriaceae bacterium]
MNNYKELKVWQKAVDLAVKIYNTTSAFPREEEYALTNQIRRSGVSIASNIAEGAGRNSKKDFKNFLSISNGSICELETQLIIANRIEFLDKETLDTLQGEITEIQKMNWSLQKTLS